MTIGTHTTGTTGQDPRADRERSMNARLAKLCAEAEQQGGEWVAQLRTFRALLIAHDIEALLFLVQPAFDEATMLHYRRYTLSGSAAKMAKVGRESVGMGGKSPRSASHRTALEVERLSILWTLEVDGKPLATLTRTQVEEEARRAGKLHRFLSAIVDAMPIDATENVCVRDVITPKVAEGLWQRAGRVPK